METKQARKERIKQGKGNPKENKDYEQKRKAMKMHQKARKEKKRNRHVHRTHRRLSGIAKPPLRLLHGTEPAVMLAHRSRPTQVGRIGAVFVVVNTELATPRQNQVCSGSARMGRAPPSAAVMLGERRLVIASYFYNVVMSARTKLRVRC